MNHSPIGLYENMLRITSAKENVMFDLKSQAPWGHSIACERPRAFCLISTCLIPSYCMLLRFLDHVPAPSSFMLLGPFQHAARK